MQLPPHRPDQRPVKRQSFSIDSLAISSHAEAASEDPGRDTESPYLRYLEQTGCPTQDFNSNIVFRKQLPSLESQLKCANFIVSQQLDAPGARMAAYGHSPYATSVPSRTTSTPKVTSCKRRRMCSTSTPPSSDDSTGEEKMAVDGSVLADDKLSPMSGSGSIASGDHEADSTCSSDGSLLCRRGKKLRTAFTGDQLRELEKRYRGQRYLTAGDRTRLARALGLKDQQVKTWFQNRRMKEKRQQRDEESAQGFSLPTGGVDVAQLAALGIYNPQLGTQLGSSTPLRYHFNSPPSPMELRAPVTSASGSALSPGLIKPQPSPVADSRGQDLQDIYRTGHFLPNASISPHLLAGSMHGVYSSAFSSVAPPRYSAASFSSPVLKGHPQST